MCKTIFITNLKVGDNGIISFNNSYNDYTPTPLPTSPNQFIAPFWANVDISGTGEVYYRQTNDSLLIARATDEIQTAFPMSHNVEITSLFIVTWNAVGYYGQYGYTDIKV